MEGLRPISSQPRSIVQGTVGIRTVSPGVRNANGKCGATRYAWSQLQRESNSDETMRPWHRLEWFVRRRAPVASAVLRAVELNRPALSEQQVAQLALDGAVVAKESLQQCWNRPQWPQARPSTPPYATPSRLHTQSRRLIHPVQRRRGGSLPSNRSSSCEARCGGRRHLLSDNRLESGGTA